MSSSNEVANDVGAEKGEAVTPAVSQKASGSIPEVLPIMGEVSMERNQFSEVFCKPKLMPIKSITLQKIEEMEAQARKIGLDD